MSAPRPTAKQKCRQYSSEYLKYGYTVFLDLLTIVCRYIMCIVSSKTLSNEVMKSSRLKDHLEKKHSDRDSKDLSYFQGLSKSFSNQNCTSRVFKRVDTQTDTSLATSYNDSKLIAKSGCSECSHTVAENVVLPTVQEVLMTVSPVQKFC